MTATSPDSASQKTRFANALAARPAQATGALVLGNGAVLWGLGLGAEGQSLGEVCFNTSMSGYQEILMDPSYAGQIITFTFPHIGNVGTNDEDIEAHQVFAHGCVLRCDITRPSNFRAAQHLSDWLRAKGMTGIAGVDTRALTRRIRDECARRSPDMRSRRRAAHRICDPRRDVTGRDVQGAGVMLTLGT